MMSELPKKLFRSAICCTSKCVETETYTGHANSGEPGTTLCTDQATSISQLDTVLQ